MGQNVRCETGIKFLKPTIVIIVGYTGTLSHLKAKLRDWANRQAEAGCYSWAALSLNDSKTRYTHYA